MEMRTTAVIRDVITFTELKSARYSIISANRKLISPPRNDPISPTMSAPQNLPKSGFRRIMA